MRIPIAYPIPFDNVKEFGPDVVRFTETFRRFPPGIDNYELIGVCAWGEPTDPVRELFYGIKTRFIPYFEDGADLGAHQLVANSMAESDYLIGMSTRCFFHREGWLKRLVEAREKHGPGIYGTGTYEGTIHIRTCAYLIDRKFWNFYPKMITSRPDTIEAERQLTEMVMRKGAKAIQVLWDDEQDWKHWREPAGAFRRGRQNAMLVWDRHTDIFAAVDPEERLRLTALADGVKGQA